MALLHGKVALAAVPSFRTITDEVWDMVVDV
jgi:hypothetical protein